MHRRDGRRAIGGRCFFENGGVKHHLHAGCTFDHAKLKARTNTAPRKQTIDRKRRDTRLDDWTHAAARLMRINAVARPTAWMHPSTDDATRRRPPSAR
jgi:hypothetical protein